MHTGAGGRAKLVVLVAEVGGGWSQESGQEGSPWLPRRRSAPFLKRVGFTRELLTGLQRGQILPLITARCLRGFDSPTQSVGAVLGERGTVL